jgi:hypothetical protein
LKRDAIRKLGEVGKGLDKGQRGPKGELILPGENKLKRDAIKKAGLTVPTVYRYQAIAEIPIRQFHAEIGAFLKANQRGRR